MADKPLPPEISSTLTAGAEQEQAPEIEIESRRVMRPWPRPDQV